MMAYINGRIITRTPTFGVIENHGIGYAFQNTLHTYELLKDGAESKLFIHTVIREDAHLLYGFAAEEERSMFRSLISVSGIGPSSALAALSSYKPKEIADAIAHGDVNKLKKIKGIGVKSAERIIVDLRDKVGAAQANFDNFGGPNNTLRSEALRALQNLGFDPRKSQIVVDKVLETGDESMSIEVLIKQSLKSL